MDSLDSIEYTNESEDSILNDREKKTFLIGVSHRRTNKNEENEKKTP